MSDPKNGHGEGGDRPAEPPREPANDRALREVEGAQQPAFEAEIAQLREELLRALAESENIRKRAERDRYEISQYAIKEFAYALLSVADNLRRAIDVMPPEAREAAAENVKSLLLGVEATERELLTVFERFKIKRLDPKGEKFNPNFHQAIAEVAGAGKLPGTVIDVAQPGYTIAERLLRPAMVTVAKAELAGDGTAEPGSSVDTKA